jgi:tetratricopeptide (TPR) repeat protein
MARGDQFMMTAEELRLHRAKRRRIFIIAVAFVLVVVIGIFTARPGLNAIKAWQARRHANKAFAYIEKANWPEARKEATAAYQLRPTEPQSVRAVARFLSRTRQPDALEFWQQLEKLTPLTREDRQDEAAIAIASGETARAEIALQALLESKGSDPIGWLLAAQLAIQKGAADDAMSALGKIFNDAQATEQEQLQATLLELALASGSEGIDERATDAWSRIEKISQGNSATGLDALVLLARRALSSDSRAPGATSTEQRENSPGSSLQAPSSSLAERLASHPLSKAPQKLLALDVQEQIDASRRDQLLAQGIAQFKNGDANDLLALATWLNGKKEFEKTLDAIPLEKALLGRELFLQYLDALGGLERWSEIKDLLLGDRYPLDPVVQKMYLARCNAQLGEKTAGENNWQRALEAAAGDPGKQITLGEYAEKNGIGDVAESAFDSAAQESPKLRVAQQGRLRLAQRSGDTKKIHAVLEEMLKIWPNDAAVANDEGYTRLLLLQQPRGRSEIEDGRSAQTLPSSISQRENQKTEDRGQRSDPNEQITNNEELITLADLAATLVARNPRSLPHRTFLALARLKQNRAADALAVYENVTVARGALTPSALAVHAAVLAANGRNEEAKSEIGQLRANQLLSEEKRLIEKLTTE